MNSERLKLLCVECAVKSSMIEIIEIIEVALALVIEIQSRRIIMT